MSDRQDLETTASAVVCLESLAGEAYGWFETAHRGDDPEQPYTRLRDGAPEWLSDLVREAHAGMLPDDWKYRCISSALECIAESDDPEDAAHEWADGECDVYTSDRLAWLSSNLRRPNYCDDAVGEMSIDYGQEGIVGLIACGQYQEAREVFASVLSSLEAQVAA